MPTSDTSGPLFTASSPSAGLQRSLENRLRAILDVNGSPEYALIWKISDMPSGPPICALRARARRISDSGFTGWPTPTEFGKDESYEAWAARKDREYEIAAWQKGIGSGSLHVIAQMAGWASPRTADAEKNVRSIEGAMREAKRKSAQNDLGTTAMMVGCATPAARDYRHPNSKPFSERGGGAKGEQLPNQVAHLIPGQAPNGSPALTEKARRAQSGIFPLADGFPNRVGLLRGAGNAIVPQVAARFIRAAIEVIG